MFMCFSVLGRCKVNGHLFKGCLSNNPYIENHVFFLKNDTNQEIVMSMLFRENGPQGEEKTDF